MCHVAIDLATFLLALQCIDTAGSPLPGPHSFYRGGSLTTYDGETRQAIAALKDKIDANAAIEVWEAALATTWQNPPVWVHGDISPSNLLLRKGQLSGVIDFGQLTAGDPACDLAIAWTLFENESRKIFRAHLPLDDGTWARGRAWALWKALLVSAGFTKTHAIETSRSWHIIGEVLATD